MARAIWAVLGSDSLLGRELRDVISSQAVPVEVMFIAAEQEEAGKLILQEDEPAVVAGLDAIHVQSADVLFLAGSAESARKAIEVGSGTMLVDLTHAAEDHPRARLRAPMAEESDEPLPPDAIHVIAHPAAIALAIFFQRLTSRFEIRRSIVHVFEPASERGAAGIDELQQQTVNLLSLKNVPKKIYDTQVGFAMLARFGEEAAAPLEETEGRIERHLASLLRGTIPLPSLRVVQAPVFHGHSFSVWVEFEDENPGQDALEQALLARNIDLRGSDMEPPNNVGIAGFSGIAIGAVAVDRNEPQAAWFWIVADNLRMAAENAVAVARGMA